MCKCPTCGQSLVITWDVMLIARDDIDAVICINQDGTKETRRDWITGDKMFYRRDIALANEQLNGKYRKDGRQLVLEPFRDDETFKGQELWQHMSREDQEWAITQRDRLLAIEEEEGWHGKLVY